MYFDKILYIYYWYMPLVAWTNHKEMQEQNKTSLRET
jgi:hypothetical protein